MITVELIIGTRQIKLRIGEDLRMQKIECWNTAFRLQA